MPTAHNQAKKEQVADVVLMPGDPLRAKFIADNFLEDVICFNTARAMLGYTGTYKGQMVSVMGSGMGMPSIGIYTYELYKDFGVQDIIRVGTAGAYSNKLQLKDLVLVKSCYSESTYAQRQNGDMSKYKYPDMETNQIIQSTSKDIKIPVVNATVHSSDIFYAEDGMEIPSEYVDEYDALAVEMESFALFHNAEVMDKKAACLLSISDNLVEDTHLSIEERQKSFDNMMKLALESAIRL